MHILYKLRFSSGKCYIGQTVRKLDVRIRAHRNAARSGSMLPVHCAWRAYGEPEIEVLMEFDSHDELHIAEIEAIAKHGTLAPSGYNLSHGGETAPSKNPEVAAKIAERATGRRYKDTSSWVESTKKAWQSEEYRSKVLAGVAASWTDERRNKSRERMATRWEEKKASGWTMSEETKEKMRQRVFTEETRAKMSASAKLRKREVRSAETRARISVSTSKSWQDEDARKKRSKAISEALKEKFASMTDAEKKAYRQVRIRGAETRKTNALKKKEGSK